MKNYLMLKPRICLLLGVLLTCFFSLSAQGDKKTITGVIKDATGEPLIGVSIRVEGTTEGSITDFDGNFELSTSNPNGTITVNYMGYKNQTIQLKGQSTFTIVLAEDSELLDEVVVVGYGTQKKVNLTGAVTALDGDVVLSKSSSDALSALQGEMAGVTVIRSGGQPGEKGSEIQIRGASTINDHSALVLIDGMEGDLSMVNPSDIANISVLKDAAASAIYGARAAAGVILVTTKTASEGKTRITYNGYMAANKPGIRPKRMPSWEEQVMINESRIAVGGKPEWNAEKSSWLSNPNFTHAPNPSNNRWDFYSVTDWLDAGMKDYATQQSHSVSISGGKKELSYFASVGYFKQDGILKYGPDGSERYNARLKVKAELNKYLDFDIQGSYDGRQTEESSYGNGTKSVLRGLYSSRGKQAIYLPTEDTNYAYNPYNGDLNDNFIDIMKNGGAKESKLDTYNAKAELTVKNLVKDLRFKLTASRKADYYKEDRIRRTLRWESRDAITSTPRRQVNNPNSLYEKRYELTHDVFEGLVYYDLKLNKHSFNFMGGMSYEDYRKDMSEAEAFNMHSNDFFSFNAFDKSDPNNFSMFDDIKTSALMSYFGRVNYNYDDRYLFEANVRHDGSSQLASHKRWSTFPSFSAAWRISEESWFDFKGSEKIDNLKLRASWGQLGMGTINGYYDFLEIYENDVYNGDPYYYQKEMASKDKTWERLTSSNIGLDIDLLKNRLSFVGDYYWKKNDDMLIRYSIPSIAGIMPPYGNIASMKAWGWEIQLNWRDKVGNVKYNVGFNLSDSQNKLTQLAGANIIGAGAVKVLEGHSLNTIWGYETDGFWNSRQEYLDYKKANPGYESFNDAVVSGGDVKYVAQGKADHAISPGGGTPDNPGDLVKLGNSTPRYTYGLNLGLEWNNFDFSMFWQGVGQRDIVFDAMSVAPFARPQNMPWTVHQDYWTPDNTNAYWSRMYNYGNAVPPFNYHTADRWIQDGSYIRLKNIQVGYTIPVNKKIMDRLRIYVSGDDVWEHTKMLEIFDPEVKNEASAEYYPFMRTWTVGLNITF